MRLIGLTIVALAIVSSAAPSPAGDGTPAGVRNCTWCHGTSGHGYANAPELAGQRHQYIENQLLDFHNHVRDNPFSQQYMWGAAANLNAQTARDLAIYFSTVPPKSANDGIPQLADIGREIYFEGGYSFEYLNDLSLEQLEAKTTFNVTELERFADCSSAWLFERVIDPKTPIRDYPLAPRFSDLPFLHVAALGLLDAVGLNGLAERFREFGAIQAVERLNLDGLLALWHPPSSN